MSLSPEPPPEANAKTGATQAALRDLACAAVKAAGLRLTDPRRSILAVLARRDQPSTIEQIHAQLGSGRCDRVTVYRCMTAFEEAGLVRRVFAPDGTGLYRLNLDGADRYHLLCRRSKLLHELDAETSAELGRALRHAEEKLRARGYTDVGHVAEFFGSPPAQNT
jgi:Fur family transcriptional regulator, ferric uptake regulator